MSRSGRVLFLVTEGWYFVSHLLVLAVEAQHAGFEVAVATRIGNHRSVIEEARLRVIPFEMVRSGLNPFTLLHEVAALADLSEPLNCCKLGGR